PRANGGDHGLDVGGIGVRRPDAVAQDRPHRVVAGAALIELDAVVERALGEHVDEVDVQAGGGRTAVDEVGGGGGKPDQLAALEHGRDHGQVGRVRRAVIGMVVDDDVALVELAGELAHEAADVGGQ